MPMPHSVLKTQLLHEWAQVIQLGTHELLELWGVQAPQAAKAGRSPRPPGRASASGGSSSGTSGWQPTRPTRAAREGAPRGRANLREDRAVVLLFHASSHWEGLSESQRGLLCELPAPHGEVFRWLDTQIQEHGPQPMAALLAGVGEQPQGDWVSQLVLQTPDVLDHEAKELEHLLIEIEKRDLDTVLADLATRASSDPEAYARFKALSERRKALKSMPYSVDPV